MGLIMQLDITAEGNLTMSVATEETTIKNQALMSVFSGWNTLFQRPDFGCRYREVDRISENNLKLISVYILDALNWLINTGKATKNEASAVQVDTHRIRIDVLVTQTDGQIIQFAVFKTVG